jgi:uncharacterized membrane protein
MRKLSNSFRKYIEKTNKNDPTAVPIFSGIIVVAISSILFLALGFSESTIKTIFFIIIYAITFYILLTHSY